MPIPPPGWGAVEILIWDYYRELVAQGHTVDIVNHMRRSQQDQSGPHTKYSQDLIAAVNRGQYDFVHLHYDCLHHILPYLTCKKKGITSHYPYIDQPYRFGADGFSAAFHGMCQNRGHTIYALSRKDRDVFARFAQDPANIRVIVNGANESEILPVAIPNKAFPDRSIYVAKVEDRKQQRKYCGTLSRHGVDFYGKCDDPGFRALDCYKGELEHGELMRVVPQYGSLVLLSKGESDALVIKEALMAGLPVVTNGACIQDVDPVLRRYVDIVPDDKADDMDYISELIVQNRAKQSLQADIREYAVRHFSWKKLVAEYIV